MKVYISSLKMYIKSMLEYKKSFITAFISQFFIMFSYYFIIIALFEKFDNIKGYTKYEVLLCFGIIQFEIVILPEYILKGKSAIYLNGKI